MERKRSVNIATKKKRRSSVRKALAAVAVGSTVLTGLPMLSGAVSGGDIISMVAGTGSAGNPGADGSSALASSIDSPEDVAIAANGDVYFADRLNHAVFKVDSSGNQTRVAGTIDTASFTGDSGPATSATLNEPRGLAFDATGNLFIADSFNHVIRRVDASTGVITTVAGSNSQGFSGDAGAATAAELDTPKDVVVNAAGEIFIADADNNRIRMVDTSADISTIAGTAAPAGFFGEGVDATTGILSNPTILALDSNEDLLIADNGNNRVRKIVFGAPDIISTVAGSNGTPGFDGDGGLATAAELSGPEGVAVAADGTIYLSDTNNNRIRKIDTSGNISTIAGGGAANPGNGGAANAATLNAPEGMALDGDGNLIYAEVGLNSIRMITLDDVAPVVTITTPANGSTIALGTNITASFGCSDAGSGLASCIATINGSTPAADGIPIPTSTAGTYALKVVGTDAVGNVTTVTSTYTVPAAVVTPTVDPRIITGSYAAGSGSSGATSRLYMAVMGRQPDASGHAYWLDQIATGTSYEAIAAFFITSPEFQTLYGNTTNSQFVDLLYLNVLLRDASLDPVGRAYWNAALAAGASRVTVTAFFAESDEFKTATQTS